MTDLQAQETNNESTGAKVEESVVSYLDDLWLALARLDERLKHAVELTKSIDTGKETDAFRGLYISDNAVDRLLAQPAGKPLFSSFPTQTDEPAWTNTESDSRMAWLARAYGLSPFELDVVLVALAPEIDLRYQRLYAFLQDDVTRKHPSIDLILNLLCANPIDKIERRRHFSADAPLIRHGIIHLVVDPNQPQAPLLANYLKLDEQIVNLLLHQQGLDSRLSHCCRLYEPAVALSDLPLNQIIQQQLQGTLAADFPLLRPICLYLQGPAGIGKQSIAEALANKLDMALLTVDLVKAVAEAENFGHISRLIFREAWFQNALIYFDGLDELRNPEHSAKYEQWLDALINNDWPVVLGGYKLWVPGRGALGVTTVELSIPEFTERCHIWRTHLVAEGVAVNEPDLKAVADRFRFTPRQIQETVTALVRLTRTNRVVTDGNEANDQFAIVTKEMLFAAARQQNNQALVNLALKIEPCYSWNDIVLPEDGLAQLREICQRVQQRHRVMDDWGFNNKLSYGKGVNALFFGPSGTGKTMAAEVIATELGLDLYKIDLSGVVSKYIGETEKNLDRIFRAAEDANAILFFDEADALFGKRSEVRDSHDRYANIEISYLLQKMEAYQGITILATNLRKNLDDAFVRRLAFCVPFPFPDAISQLHIWKGIWPKDTPVSENADFESLAQQFKLSGGNIKNSAVAAAFLAAEADSPVAMDHLLQAIHREFQKLGKAASAMESQPAPTEIRQSVEG